MIENILTTFTDKMVKQLAIACIVKIFYANYNNQEMKEKIKCIVSSY